MLPKTMKALRVESYQGPGGVELVELPTPKAKAGSVVIKVGAAGINFADVAQSHGAYPGGPKPPYTPGLEAAGEIVAVGEGVRGWSVGQRAVGMGIGAFAEYCQVSARSLFPVSKAWSDAQAAAMPVQWLTAHGCLRTVGRLQAGETVLIHAVAGGVGQAALRLARHFGATTIGTASTAAKLASAAERGLDHGINSREQDLVQEIQRITGGEGVDLILEMVGGDTFRANLKAVRPYGRIVVFGAASNEPAQINNVNLIFSPVELQGYHLTKMMVLRPDLFAAELVEFNALIKEGVVLPEAPTAWPLADGPRALAAVKARETIGKQVLVP